MSIKEEEGGCLVPRPILCFVLQFALTILHGSGRAVKMGKVWEYSSHE